MTKEHSIQNDIRNNTADIAVLFRANVGKGITYDGRHFDTRLPVGFSDLFGFRISDGRAVFIEVKAPGGRLRSEQVKFMEKMWSYGAIAGVAHSVEEARELIQGG
ncbi:MAG: VRR-NUC domain-containing protein [Oscillospiraceae bacterium]|nr:VRR-NUC domain-containing protein [Oscillospiraceae bacterium]